MRRLVELVSETNGVMRVVLFAAEDVRTARIREALGGPSLGSACSSGSRAGIERPAWFRLAGNLDKLV